MFLSWVGGDVTELLHRHCLTMSHVSNMCGKQPCAKLSVLNCILTVLRSCVIHTTRKYPMFLLRIAILLDDIVILLLQYYPIMYI